MSFPTSSHPHLSTWILLAIGAALAGCGGGGDPEGGADAGADTGAPPVVEEWALSEVPLVEIGVREGEDAYQLHRVRGSVLLDDGRVVVLNGGSQELRYFDADGQFLRSVGGRGEGPGEYQYPAGLRKTAEGGLQVWDGSLMRISLLEVEGTFKESSHLLASNAEMFPGDDWLFGQNWIVSPVPPGARGPIRNAVEALPLPDSLGLLRVLQVTQQGRIWAPRERPPAPTPVTWDVYDLRGRPVARVSTPARFQPHEIGEDYVTGLFLDEVDVNYVRVYGLEKPPGSPAGPGLDLTVSTMPSDGAPPRPAPPEQVMAEIRSLIKNMASLEEIYYSDHYTYITDVEALFRNSRTRPPDELDVDILFADTNGWAGTVTHTESGGRCVLAYGRFVPMGWQPGAVICL